VGTHRLREVRVRQLDQARALIRDGRAAEALLLLDEADHWPNTAGPGRVDYGRAEAYLQLKDRYRAEIHYHRACEADPAFYWALADLALFYANAPEPLAQRQRQAEPYIALLKERFAKSPQLPGLLKKLGRKLGPAATQTARR
jgi:tetratricopeptide (TPR) repeat protein